MVDCLIYVITGSNKPFSLNNDINPIINAIVITPFIAPKKTPNILSVIRILSISLNFLVVFFILVYNHKLFRILFLHF